MRIVRHLAHEWRDFYSFRYPITSSILIFTAVCLLTELVLFGCSPSAAQLLSVGGANYDSLHDPSRWWQLLTSNFVHASVWHYLSVAIGLWYMAGRVEAKVGQQWLGYIAVAGCLGSSIAGVIVVRPYLVQVGASGIVAAACGAGLAIDPAARLRLGKMARWFLLSFGLYALIARDYSTAAHIGGIVSGLLIGVVWALSKRRQQAFVNK